MTDAIHHRVQPQLVKDTHDPLDLIDFELVGAGRKLIPGSVRFEGELKVTQANADLVAQNIGFDCRAGIGSFIDSVTTSFQNVGQIEAINNYPRLLAMNSNAKQADWDMVNSNMSVEMKSPDDAFSVALLRKPTVQSASSPIKMNPDFSHRLFNCLNRVSSATVGGDNAISMSKTGAIRVSISLARVFDALEGMDVDANTNFVILNPTVCFTSVLDDDVKSTIQMRVESSIKSSLNSSHSVISTRVPIVANGVSMSFQQLSHESSPTYNNVAQEELPNLETLVFLFNNASSEHVTYTINSRAEVLSNYIESMKVSGDTNTCSLQLLKANKSYGVGIAFSYMDLSSQAFNVQMDTQISSATPYVAYLFFHGIVEL